MPVHQQYRVEWRKFMSQKIVFFDIDGTIWDEHMVIPESTRLAITKLKENGHKAFLCTGRARAAVVSKELFDMGFDGIIASCGTYIEMDNEIVFEELVPDELVKKIVSVLKENNMPVVLEGSRDYWIDEVGFEEDPYVDYLRELIGEHAHALNEYSEDIRINKFSADIIANTDYDMIKAELSGHYDILEHAGNVVEFVPKGFSKATGIKWLCDYLKLDMADTYALGDSVNDLEMLQTVGHGIAMGNATDVVKKAAEYVTDSLFEAGVYNALSHYDLIK